MVLWVTERRIGMPTNRCACSHGYPEYDRKQNSEKSINRFMGFSHNIGLILKNRAENSL
jgi:hypothetical protein